MLLHLPVPFQHDSPDPRTDTVWDLAVNFLTAYASSSTYNYSGVTFSNRQVMLRWGILRSNYVSARRSILGGTLDPYVNSYSFRLINQIFFPADECSETQTEIFRNIRLRLNQVDQGLQLLNEISQYHTNQVITHHRAVDTINQTYQEFQEIFRLIGDLGMDRVLVRADFIMNLFRNFPNNSVNLAGAEQSAATGENNPENNETASSVSMNSTTPPTDGNEL